KTTTPAKKAAATKRKTTEIKELQKSTGGTTESLTESPTESLTESPTESLTESPTEQIQSSDSN
ncbi:MAG TPA: hypothetical protein VFV86_07865, partial [Nitrososphaeraceae archaeon]|nr:hypothetical protein [Nitrososphaeraceae archaeon]